MTCAVDDCSKPALTRGHCAIHYYRLLRYGDPHGGSTQNGQPLKFLLAAIEADTQECILWPFSTVKGYGKLGLSGRTVQAHREVCRRVHGEAPSPKHDAAHSCGNGKSGCINPKHLRWATRVENMADKVIHGTQLMGSRCHMAKLTEAGVVEIKLLLSAGSTAADIARAFGVTHGAIQSIKEGRSWRHV